MRGRDGVHKPDFTGVNEGLEHRPSATDSDEVDIEQVTIITPFQYTLKGSSKLSSSVWEQKSCSFYKYYLTLSSYVFNLELLCNNSVNQDF